MDGLELLPRGLNVGGRRLAGLVNLGQHDPKVDEEDGAPEEQQVAEELEHVKMTARNLEATHLGDREG